MSLTTRRTAHRLTIEAPGDLIFRILSESSHWPYLDGLTVYAERVSGDDSDHELRTSIVANGSLSSSHCQRVFDASELRAEFRQLGLEPPLRSLCGGWAIRRAGGFSEVILEHEFEVDEDAGDLPELIHRTLNDFSRRELEALRLSCERIALLVQQNSTAGTPAPTGASQTARQRAREE